MPKSSLVDSEDSTNIIKFLNSEGSERKQEVSGVDLALFQVKSKPAAKKSESPIHTIIERRIAQLPEEED